MNGESVWIGPLRFPFPPYSEVYDRRTKQLLLVHEFVRDEPVRLDVSRIEDVKVKIRGYHDWHIYVKYNPSPNGLESIRKFAAREHDVIGNEVEYLAMPVSPISYTDIFNYLVDYNYAECTKYRYCFFMAFWAKKKAEHAIDAPVFAEFAKSAESAVGELLEGQKEGSYVSFDITFTKMYFEYSDSVGIDLTRRSYLTGYVLYESTFKSDRTFILREEGECPPHDLLCYAKYGAEVKVQLINGAVYLKQKIIKEHVSYAPPYDPVKAAPFAVKVAIVFKQIPIEENKQLFKFEPRYKSDIYNGRLPMVIEVAAFSLYNDFSEAFRAYKDAVKKLMKAGRLPVIGELTAEKTELSILSSRPPIPRWADGIIKDMKDEKCHPIKESMYEDKTYYSKTSWKPVNSERCKFVPFGSYIIGKSDAVLSIKHEGKKYIVYKEMDKYQATQALFRLVLGAKGEIDGNLIKISSDGFEEYLHKKTGARYSLKMPSVIENVVTSELRKIDGAAYIVPNTLHVQLLGKRNKIEFVIFMPQLGKFVFVHTNDSESSRR